jgi:hypothetical protein
MDSSGTPRTNAVFPFTDPSLSPRESTIPVILNFNTISPLKKYNDYYKLKSLEQLTAKNYDLT